jgi:hypothetical protein
MNPSLKLLALAASLLGTSTAALATTPGTVEPMTTPSVTAENAFSVNAFRVANKTDLRMFVQKNAATAVWVELKNEQGDVLFESTIGKRQAGRAYSLKLSELPVGHYTLEVSSRDKKVVKAFNLAE